MLPSGTPVNPMRQPGYGTPDTSSNNNGNYGNSGLRPRSSQQGTSYGGGQPHYTNSPQNMMSMISICSMCPTHQTIQL